LTRRLIEIIEGATWDEKRKGQEFASVARTSPSLEIQSGNFPD
jgi:hypothetical protein